MAIKKQGNKQIDLPEVTTAQRSTEKGRLQFNTTLGLAEYYDGATWKAIDAPPTVSSVSPTTANGSGVTITITGSGFSTTGTTVVKFIGTASTELSGTSVNVVSSTSITVVTPALTVAEEAWGVKVINPSGLSNTLATAVDAGSAPAFTTAAGSIGSVAEGATDFTGLSTLVATDADGDAITYAITSGALPSGVSMNTSTAALTGTAPAVGTNTTYTFTVTATDAKTNPTSREFTMVVTDISYLVATGGTETTDGDYKVRTFNNSGTFTVTSVGSGASASDKVQWLGIAGGGGGGGGRASDGNHASGGGGGAGGMRFNNTNDFTVTAQAYTVTVGGGGAGGGGFTRGTTGSTSHFGNAYDISGGGGGGSAQTEDGLAGGSGGGAASDFSSDGSAGAGDSGGYTPDEGNAGGTCSGNNGSAGGGGHGAVGGNGGANTGGAGGAGTANSITGASVTYAGGGGGGNYGNSGQGSGGSGGGGAGGTSPTAGTDNLGGGGGGNNNPDNNNTAGGTGGKGVVIIRYKFQ